jgi:elongation factor G
VWIRVEPLSHGEGFEFVNEIKGASVPTNYIPSVEKGVQDTLESGRLAGYPVVDLRVTLDDGSSHPVDSSDMAFRKAGQLAMRQALDEAGERLLEPVVVVEVTTPDDIMGDVMSDINGRRGQIQGMKAVGKGLQRVQALVPMSEIVTYAADLRSLSQGRASYTMEFAHYQSVPANLMERIVTESVQQQASQ